MPISRRLVAALAAIACASGALPALAITGPDPGVPNVHFPAGSIFRTASSGTMAFPSLFNAGITRADGTRTSRLLSTYGTGSDVPGANSTALIESTDEGATWTARPLPVNASGKVSANLNNVGRLADAAGTVVAIDYEPIVQSEQASNTGLNQRTFHRWTINGSVFSRAGDAVVNFPGYPEVVMLRFHKNLLLLGDGTTLLGSVYGASVGAADKVWFTALVRSTDDGKTWTQIHRFAEGVSYAEASVAPTSDGGLMAWMRRDNAPDQTDGIPDLYYSSTADPTGASGWTAPLRMSSDTGNQPMATQLANGAAVMASGRPDNVVRYKLDGTSGWSGWTGRTNIYDNHPRSGSGNLLTHGSSGTVSIVPLTANTLLALGDNCASHWGCPSSMSGYPRGTSQSLWKTQLEVNTSQWGKIDLQSKFRRGEISYVAPTFTTYGRGRQSLGAYAFDGDVRADSSVVTSNRSVTLKLDRTYDLTGLTFIGHLTGAVDVRIETSTDGTTWTAPARNPRVGALRPFATGVSARYLRISDPNSTSSNGRTFLHEIEVYSMLDGFEGNVIGSAPAGNGLVSGSSGATVESLSLLSETERISGRALRLRDTSTTSSALIRWSHGSGSQATFEFRARAYGTANRALLFTLDGLNGSTKVHPYHFMLDWKSGTFSRYSFATGSWTRIGTVAITSNYWNSVKVVAGPNSATLVVNGVTVGSATPSQAFTSITGNAFSSAGSVPTGDYWLIDDVGFTRP